MQTTKQPQIGKITLAFLVMFALCLSVFAIEVPAWQNKTENGKTGSTQDIVALNIIGAEQTDHYIFMHYDKALNPKQVIMRTSDFSFKKATTLYDIWAVPITSMISFQKPFIQQQENTTYWNETITTEICDETCYNQTEIIEHQTTKNYNTTYYLPYVNLTLGIVGGIDNTKYEDYLIGYRTNNFVQTDFNWTDFDPVAVPCGSYATPNTVLTMNESISVNGSTCITIAAQNITLDCAGFTITGNNSSATYGVYSNQFNTTIKNCLIQNFSININLAAGAHDTLIQNNTLTSYGSTSSSYHGISIVGTNNARIKRNRIYDGHGGIWMPTTGMENVSIDANNISVGRYAIWGTADTPNLNITNNNLNASDRTTFLIRSSGARVINNSIYYLGGSASYKAFEVIGAHNLIAENNSIFSNTNGFYATSGDNITLDCMGASVIGSNASTGYGIYSSEYNTTIKNCNVSNFSTGIYINGDSADYANIANNTINITYSTSCSGTTGVCDAIFGNANDFATITNNTIYAYEFGISNFNDADDWTIEKNNVTTTQRYGIYLYSVNRNIVNQNIVTTAGQYGIYARSKEGHNITNNTVSSSSIAISINVQHSNAIIEYNNVSTATSSAVLVGNSNNATVRHNNLTAGTDYAVYISTSNESFVFNNTLKAGTHAIRINNGLRNNVTTNNIEGTGNIGVYISNGASDNAIANNTISGPYGVYLTATCNNNNVTSNNITYNGTVVPAAGISVYATSNFTLIEKNIITPQYSNASNAVYICDTCYFTQIINNTINTSITSASAISTAGYNGTFYYNNISGQTWITNTGSGNNFNTTGIGNIYYNSSGAPSWAIYNISTTSPPNWATGGSDRPFSATTTPSYWANNGEDYYPWVGLTNKITNCSISSQTNATIGHSFNITASCDSEYSGSFIASTNASTTIGTCEYLSYSITANTYSATYRCNYTVLQAQTNTTITFTDIKGFSNSTSALNIYPDPNMPIFPLTILPAYANENDNLTCSIVNWTDADGDLLNSSSINYTWLNDSGIMIGQNNATLISTSFAAGDSISCWIYSEALNWSTSNATVMTGATVILPAPTFAINATIIYPNTGSTFGPAQCWILTELYTVINGTPADMARYGYSSASSICRLYYWDGYANTSYNLVQTLNAANASPTFNFTAINVSGAYRINCTVFVDTYNASSQNVDISIIGTSLCTTTPTPSGNTTTTYILSNVFDSEINTQGYGVFTLLLGMYVLIVIIFPSVLEVGRKQRIDER